MSDYPEHDKLKTIQEKSQAIGEFIESSDYVLCRHRDVLSDRYVPTIKSINQILADYFEIDLHKIEEEKRAMLNSMRE